MCQGLCARRYGLWASHGLDFRDELTARTPLQLLFLAKILKLAAGQHVFCSDLYGEHQGFNIPLHVLWAPCSTYWAIGYDSLVMLVFPTRAWAPRSVLRLVGCGSLVMPVHPTRVKVSALDVMDYGLVKA